MKVENKPLYTVYEVMAILDCSLSKAYKVIQEMNAELKQRGYYIVAGKVNSQYFRDKLKLDEKEVNTMIDIEEAKQRAIKSRSKSNANK